MNVVFDFAGVLFHWQPAQVVARALSARAYGPAELQACVDAIFQGYGGDWAEFDRGTVEPDALAQRIAARTGLGVDEVAAVIDAVAPALQPDLAMVRLIERLHAQGVPLYFLSNMPAPYARHLDEQHAFLRRFRTGVYSGRVRLIKPEPAIFAHALAAFGGTPAETLFFDDVAANVQAAKDAGWQARLHRDAAQCERELRQLGLLRDAA